MNLLASNTATISSTGGLEQDSLCRDSVKISYCDLRKVNAKLVELEYEKEINKNLKSIISNDSLAINDFNNRLIRLDSSYKGTIRELKKERNIAGGISIVSIILLVLSIL